MTAYIEWIDPFDATFRPVICKMSFRDIVYVQIKRQPLYTAERAIDDFLVVYWGEIIRDKMDDLEQFYIDFAMSKYATKEDRDFDIANHAYSVKRPKFKTPDLDKVISQLMDKIAYRISTKGTPHLSSDFECMGLIDQEVYEYRRAIHEKLHNQARVEELLDIAWAALLGVMMNNQILDKDNDSPSSHLF